MLVPTYSCASKAQLWDQQFTQPQCTELCPPHAGEEKVGDSQEPGSVAHLLLPDQQAG